MATTRTIGKNTLGDNEKMRVHLHDYEMSSHNLSYVFRSTIGVGMLVPFMKIVAQKGDIFDIQLTNKTMTHPTRGPLFGAFKLQHFIFTAGFRLYNSWLHNNRTGIGMKMSDIKFPVIEAFNIENKKEKFNSSSLHSYLGWKGANQKTGATTAPAKNAIPWLIYFDIFKNYFANTQEENFYIITKGKVPETLQVQGEITVLPGTPSVGNNAVLEINHPQFGFITQVNTVKLTATTNETLDWAKFWGNVELEITYSSNQTTSKQTVSQLTTSIAGKTVTLDRLLDESQTGESVRVRAYSYNGELSIIGLTPEKLETLDKVRDEILKTPGNTTLRIIPATTDDVKNFFKKVGDSRNNKLGGLVVKTYDSDIFNNWVKTDWIDGENGINKITALKPDADGNITMDALNLQQKVYNMLNRIAVSGGTYRDWLETVYTAGRYLDRPETPVFQGGMSQIIEFDEVIATTGNQADNQVLGDLAGRGYATKPNGSGHLHFQVEEPGYVFGVMAITPICDYSQGNDFDLNLRTMDDLHKPALDGIGYQDSMNEQRAWWTAEYNGTVGTDTTPGKTVAWIDYMTNFNKTFGNFAVGENEDFMVLNRNYQQKGENEIGNITTYIDPQEHIDIFADTALDSQNFWIQTACEIIKRGNYSAKQIPNL